MPPSHERLSQLLAQCLSFGRSQVTPPLPGGRMIQLDGRGETFVREIPGPADSVPIVLLHGWGMTADVNYVDVYEPLSATHRVIAPDIRMHGRGPRDRGFTVTDAADDVIALLDMLDIERAIICGFSMGGVIAADIVTRHPARVAGTVVAASAACYRNRWRDRLIFAGLNALQPLLTVGIDPPPGPLVLAGARGRTDTAMQRQRWMLGELMRNRLSDIVSVSGHAQNVDLRPRLAAGTKRPSEYLLLNRDRVCHPQMQQELADLLGAHTTTLDLDHDVVVADPAQYAQLVVAAVGRLDAQLESARTVSA
ncbi:alpha/beta fold hydrolase [Mycolicibacterium sp. CBMA 226]|uniref:alpha/beta fold hydrolase n=1 Tax=Mycolicibacterium sp. CBMA 226 TaxID=2606611 RepID=UPI0012DDEB63|nr:alpha/beta hydrolase [Mycolicibacterium sp. CBMA 226]MUL78732.1 alpha/beta hydrolase [Mycolicibacterium sp. CBMA 226]